MEPVPIGRIPPMSTRLQTGHGRAWLKKCHFQVTPEIDRALVVKGFLVFGVTLI